MSAEGDPPTDARELTAPIRAWAAYALVGATAALLLGALIGLFPSTAGAYSLYAASRFGSFVNLATIGLPVAAVYLATHVAPRLPAARLITLVALVELGVAALFGTLFGAIIGLYGLVSHGPGAAAGLAAMLAWLGHLAVLGVAGIFCLRVWQGLFAGRRAVPGAGTPPSGPAAAAFRPGTAGQAEQPAPEHTAFLRAGSAGDLPTVIQPGASSPAATTAFTPTASPAPPPIVAGIQPPVSAPPPLPPIEPLEAPRSQPSANVASLAFPLPPRTPDRSTGSVYGSPAPSPTASPDVAAALAGHDFPLPTAAPPTVAIPTVPPPRNPLAGDQSTPPADPLVGAPDAPDATQVLGGPQGTQVLPRSGRPGPETTHLLPPHER